MDGELHRVLPRHEFVAGRISLDFCNTLSRTRQDADWDRAQSPQDFLNWTERLGIGLKRAPTTAALARLLELRGALSDMFDAVVDQRAPSARGLTILNRELADARMAERLVAGDQGFVLADGARSAIDRFRHAVARDAAQLLTGELRRVKRCPNHDCRWLFYDASRNLSRRWCAMEDCGTSDKVRRFRQRRQDA